MLSLGMTTLAILSLQRNRWKEMVQLIYGYISILCIHSSYPILSPIHINTLNVDTFTVVTQYFEAEVVSEYVIRGNTAVLKCNIPSFVADFVKVEAWVDSDGGEYLYSDDIGILPWVL